MRKTFLKTLFEIFQCLRKTVLIDLIIFKFVLGNKVMSSLHYLLGWLFTKKLGFLQITFLELCSTKISKLFQNTAIWLIINFQDQQIRFILHKQPTNG